MTSTLIRAHDLPQRRRIAAFHLTAMMGWWDGILGAALAAMCGYCCGCCCALAQDSDAKVVCGGETVANATVSRIIDGRTFVLNDGREVRLAAIEVPPLPSAGQWAPAAEKSARDASQLDAAEHEGTAAKAALDALIGGDQVVLRQADISLSNNLDRYGRIVAYAYALRDGEELFAQGALLESGFARAADRIGNKNCAAELLAAENTARSGKLGLWGDPYYDVLNADAPVDVLAQRGRFALVEGQVVSVRESGAMIYVNFGRRWSESFAVTISKRNERNFTEAGLDLKSLAGRRVRVRGFIEARGAEGDVPSIEAARPEQIEVANQN
jgi:endonuclease YncB( thermonuclease family)